MSELVFITPIPAFYKINLYEQISEQKKVHAVFLSENTSEVRGKDFLKQTNSFRKSFLSKGTYQQRNRLKNSLKLYKLLQKEKPKRLLIGGWDALEYWIAIILFSKKTRIELVLESSLIESSTKGYKGVLKRFFLKRIEKVFASGKSHKDLIQRLNFRGRIILTKGVGIINKEKKVSPLKFYENKFMFVGRLDEVKNLNFLIACFNKNPSLKLKIIGEGPLEANLKKQVISKNIQFVGSVPNKDLSNYFSNSNYIILPSISEPWGIITEEAFYNGLPVIISKNCGSNELLENGKNGFVFDPLREESLDTILSNITSEIYNEQCSYIKSNFIDSKDKKQVEVYLAD
jgi:glycosyltransferase involved in cell wall biosynthesis